MDTSLARLVEQKAQRPTPKAGQVRLCVSPDTGELLDAEPVLDRSATWYLISNSDQPRHVVSGTCPVTSLDGLDGPLRGSVRYRLQCPPDTERRLLKALLDVNAGGLREALEQLIMDAVQAVLSEGESTDEQELCELAGARLQELTGLVGSLWLRKQVGSGTISTGEDHVELVVLPGGARRSVDMRARLVGLGEDPEELRLAGSQLVELLERWPVSCFVEDLDMVIREVTEALREEYPEIRRVELALTNELPAVDSFLVVEHAFFCPLEQDYAGLRLACTLQLRFVSPTAYLRSGCPSIQQEAAAELEVSVRDAVYRDPFTEVVGHLAAYAKPAASSLRTQLRRLGYELVDVWLRPDLAEVLEPFALELSVVCRTATPGVELEVVLRGLAQLTNLGRGAIYLRPKRPVRPELERSLREQIEDCFGRLETAALETDGGRTVARTLRAQLVHDSAHRFGVDLSVELDVGQSRNVQPLETLYQAPLDLEVYAQVFNEARIRFDGRLRVDGILPGRNHIFFNRAATREELVAESERHLSAVLPTWPLARLLYTGRQARAELHQTVQECLGEHLGVIYGLDVRVTVWRREALPGEGLDLDQAGHKDRLRKALRQIVLKSTQDQDFKGAKEAEDRLDALLREALPDEDPLNNEDGGER